jgi:hypothetical protein
MNGPWGAQGERQIKTGSRPWTIRTARAKADVGIALVRRILEHIGVDSQARASPRHAGPRCGTIVMRRWATVSMQRLPRMNQPHQRPTTRLISASTGELQSSDSDPLPVGLCRSCCQEAKRPGRAVSPHSGVATGRYCVQSGRFSMTAQGSIFGRMRLNCLAVLPSMPG